MTPEVVRPVSRPAIDATENREGDARRTHGRHAAPETTSMRPLRLTLPTAVRSACLTALVIVPMLVAACSKGGGAGY